MRMTQAEKQALADAIRATMVADRLSQSALAQRIGVDQPAVNRVLSLRYHFLTPVVKRIADYVNLPGLEGEQLALPLEATAALGRYLRTGGDPVALSRIVDLVTTQLGRSPHRSKAS
jgi:transcriptional regulator with XRE-family HTH domain